jgi:hypothetical protein
MDKTLEEFVRHRGHGCCEYCLLPSQFASNPFEIDHIVAKQHGGQTVAGNLALVCFACNHHKGPNLAGVDPRTRKKTWLYNPRRHTWQRHFRWDGPILIGRTAVGRTTIMVLAINLAHRLSQRAALIEEGLFPPRW